MQKLHHFIKQYRILSIIIGLIFLTGVSILASRISLEEDVTGLIPSGEKQNTLKKVLAQTQFSDKIIFTVSSTSAKNNPEALTAYATRLIDSIHRQLPNYIKDIQGKVPEESILEVYDFVYNNLPLFLNENDYKLIEDRLQQDSIQDRLETGYKSLISPTGFVTKRYVFKDPLSLTALGLNKLEELSVGDDFQLYNNYLLTKDKQHLLLFLSPKYSASETEENGVLVQELRRIKQELNENIPGVKGEFFGGLLYAVANANQIKKDIRLTLGIASSILLLLLIFYYKRVYVPLLLFIPSIIGGVTAIAFLFLFKGTISAISIGIGAILLGISIDYALHILTHYRNNNNITTLYKDVTGPVLMSSTTTAIAFLCLLFVKSDALNDLGIFAALSVLVASGLALILIPQLYKVPKVNLQQGSNFIDRLAAVQFHKNKYLVGAIFVIFLICFFFFTKVKFNNDLSAINYQPEEILKIENDVLKIAGKAGKSVYLVSYGTTVDEALEHNNKLYHRLNTLEKLGGIDNFSSIGGVVLSTKSQLEKIERWEEFWNPERVKKLENDLIEKSKEYRFKSTSFNAFYTLLHTNFEPIALLDYKNTSTLYLDDFISSSKNFATVTTSVEIEETMLDNFIAQFPKESNLVVVDRKQINQNFLGNLKNDFNNLVAYSIIAVFLVLMLFYRSLEVSLLTLLPIAITWVIALGIMAMLGIEFNILNIIISTFIFGLGLDYSIFITNAFLKEYELGEKVLGIYRTSILLSVCTTLLGIGALFFAKHPALRSISVISIIGVLSALLVAFVIQGYIFDRLFIIRMKSGKSAFNFMSVLTKATKKDRLYFKRAIYDNYRYKKVYPVIKKEMELQKERYLKISEHIEETDQILHFYSGFGVLPIYLSYKKPKAKIHGIEPELSKLKIAENCFASRLHSLTYSEEIPMHPTNYNIFIISQIPLFNLENEMNELIAKQAKTVIILDSNYAYRWILDLNYEISYRQNEVVILTKMD
ncbi:MMPL family transporter [Gillisia sp. M10.2A]|uniref:MMPL family transporter n=1 Tax=Gillisia lutea TaxID=2909668 RepID=A0ABS9EFI8_9FLAO|nr:MMPL family transporter [Gillisia lutea]MCF4101631.1 MMPL family transporter [Gillisia lutea]